MEKQLLKKFNTMEIIKEVNFNLNEYRYSAYQLNLMLSLILAEHFNNDIHCINNFLNSYDNILLSLGDNVESH